MKQLSLNNWIIINLYNLGFERKETFSRHPELLFYSTNYLKYKPAQNQHNTVCSSRKQQNTNEPLQEGSGCLHAFKGRESQSHHKQRDRWFERDGSFCEKCEKSFIYAEQQLLIMFTIQTIKWLQGAKCVKRAVCKMFMKVLL